MANLVISSELSAKTQTLIDREKKKPCFHGFFYAYDFNGLVVISNNGNKVRFRNSATAIAKPVSRPK